ncbi:MAG: FecR family protein [Candidatus Eremiobacterota bacterium]
MLALAAAGLIAGVSLAKAPLEVATPEAAIVYMQNDVEVAPPGAGYRDPRSSDVLTSGWKIRTGEKSAADLLLWDESLIRLHDKTEVIIVDLTETEQGNFVRKLQLTTGRVWADVQKRDGANTFEVKGPQAVAAVKGTSFVVETLEDAEVGDAGTEVQVWDGLVECSSLDGVREQVGVDSEFIASKKRKAWVQKFDRAATEREDGWVQRNIKSRQQLRAYLQSLPKGPRGTINPRTLDPRAKQWLKTHFNQLPPSYQRKLKQKLRPPGWKPRGEPGTRPGLKPPGGATPRPGLKPTPRPLPPRRSSPAPRR